MEDVFINSATSPPKSQPSEDLKEKLPKPRGEEPGEVVCNCSGGGEGIQGPEECDPAGRCSCLPGYAGPLCDDCEDGYFTNGSSGCLPCRVQFRVSRPYRPPGHRLEETAGDSSSVTDRTGEDRTGEDRRGQDRRGQDRRGQERRGQERTGRERRGQERTGEERTGQDRRGQDGTGEERTGEERRGQGRTGEDRTGQDRTGEERTGQERRGEERRGEDRRGEDRTRTGQEDRRGQERTGEDRSRAALTPGETRKVRIVGGALGPDRDPPGLQGLLIRRKHGGTLTIRGPPGGSGSPGPVRPGGGVRVRVRPPGGGAAAGVWGSDESLERPQNDPVLREPVDLGPRSLPEPPGERRGGEAGGSGQKQQEDRGEERHGAGSAVHAARCRPGVGPSQPCAASCEQNLDQLPYGPQPSTNGRPAVSEAPESRGGPREPWGALWLQSAAGGAVTPESRGGSRVPRGALWPQRAAVAPESRKLLGRGGRCGPREPPPAGSCSAAGGAVAPESRPLQIAARPRGALWPQRAAGGTVAPERRPPAGVMAPLDLDQYAEIAKE
ncbi:hypothetical protein CRUP_013865, partial [Coryphaenoides rupestris]